MHVYVNDLFPHLFRLQLISQSGGYTFTWKVLIPFLVVQSLTLEYCYYSWHVYHTQGQFGRDSTMEVNSRLDVKPSILMIMSNGTNL